MNRHADASCRNLLSPVLVLSAAFIIGCGGDTGPPRAAVHGDVTYAGAPLKEGFILFVPSGDALGPKAGGVIQDGRYDLAEEVGPIVGRLRVEIRARRHWGYDRSEPTETVLHIGEPVPPGLIPAVYNDQSELTVETSSEGQNRFDFHLAADPNAAR